MHEQGKAAMWCGLLLFTAPAAGAVTPPAFRSPGLGRHDAFSVLARPALLGPGAPTGRRETGLLAALRARLPRARVLRARPPYARPPRGLWPISAPPRP
ncbi:hypothetical protein WKI65_06245 [Streptomyces sp. MS1.AVA.3]|uniref:hypothetical protein n=1 Tax=Streptomyces decoyicus TaxID=249567 RepID=UPI0030C50498